MEDQQGTEGEWFLVTEAECADDPVNDEYEELFDSSPVVDLVDDASVLVQGNSLGLFQAQELEESERQVQQLKRKFLVSPEKDLSPRLASVSISPQGKADVKKKLFKDSGFETESQCTVEEANISNNSANTEEICSVAGAVAEVDDISEIQQELASEVLETQCKTVVNKPLLNLLKCSNIKATLLSLFKEGVGVSYNDLTRPFQSNKTCSADWVGMAYGIREDMAQAQETLLKPHCSYMLLHHCYTEKGPMFMFLLRFNVEKCRSTLLKLLCPLLGTQEHNLLLNPPKTRSTVAALFWFKHSNSSLCCTFGTAPEWITAQTSLQHQLAFQQPFNLSDMVQWAYDNDLTDESQIAYQYALLGEEDENAHAFLQSTSQAKYVKDCCTMVRLYKRAERNNMSMSEWIHRQCQLIDTEGDWKVIVHFLKFQSVSFVSFMATFKQFLRGVPKKNCLCIFGPPNTGKSMFTMSLLQFLKGKVICYSNSKSVFWLQPLVDTKLGLLDDATMPCWKYIDTNLRNLLDGNEISVEVKHKAPFQMKCPPLLITTNVNVKEEDSLRYLHSRLQMFNFPTEFPFTEDGSPLYQFTAANWKAFFQKFWGLLELDIIEDSEDGDAAGSFRVCTRKTS